MYRVDGEAARATLRGPVVLFQRRHLLRLGVAATQTLRVSAPVVYSQAYDPVPLLMCEYVATVEYWTACIKR